MQTLEFDTTDVRLNSYYTVKSQSGTKTVTSQTATETRVITVSGIEDGWTVLRGVVSATVSRSTTGVRVCTINNEDIRSMMPSGSETTATVSIRLDVKSNRDVTLTFKYQCRGNINRDAGTYPETISITNIKLTLTCQEGEETAPPEPRMVLVPKTTVKLFDPHETVFAGNGLCILSPTSCEVSEEAGGEYELEMEHPIDQYGKWELLREDYIIEAPIPPMYIPEVTMPPWSVWYVSKEAGTDLYTTLPSYTQVSGYDKVVANPTQYTWNSGTYYPVGRYCTWPANSYPKTIYVSITEGNTGHSPTSSGWNYYWSKAGTVSAPDESQGEGKFNPGTIKEKLPYDTIVYKLTDYSSSWMQVRTRLGLTGYVKKDDVTEKVGETAQITEPSRIRYTQLFRIYKVSCEDDTHTIAVSARHVSYDLQANCLYDVQVEDCEPATTIGIIQGSVISPDEQEWQWADMTEPAPRKILCDMTEPKVKGNWSFQNPIQALLDPEEGLAGKVKARVIRDNQDIYILKNNAPRRGIKISYGINLRGVTWSRSVEDVITRIVPRGKDKDDAYLYLDELFVDSEYIGDYAFARTEVLDTEWKEGQKIKHLDGTESPPLSRSEVLEKILEAAEDRLYVDHCDAVTVSLDVEFLLIGDTEEYKQYRNLERVQLYDMITVDTGITRLRTTAQVTGYEWDCLRGRYNSISIGKVYKQSRRGFPGYRLAQGAITYSKLAPDLITYIKGAD